MESQGFSNDTIKSLNPVACILMGPLVQHVLSTLRRRKIASGPIVRMTVGFLFIAAGIGYAAGIQRLIYSRGPCYRYPLECAAANQGTSNAIKANKVSVWLQTPLQFLLAIGEILCLVSLSEYTYTEAPTNLKALVQAFQEVAAAFGAAIGIGLGPVSKNPWLVIMFASLAGAMTVTTALFWLIFRSHDADYANADAEALAGHGKDEGGGDDIEAGTSKKETGESDSHLEEITIENKLAEGLP